MIQFLVLSNSDSLYKVRSPQELRTVIKELKQDPDTESFTVFTRASEFSKQTFFKIKE